jgi:hypothetical protein
MRRPHEWTTPDPVTRRDQVLAMQVCDPPSGSHDRDGIANPRGHPDLDRKTRRPRSKAQRS